MVTTEADHDHGVTDSDCEGQQDVVLPQPGMCDVHDIPGFTFEVTWDVERQFCPGWQDAQREPTVVVVETRPTIHPAFLISGPVPVHPRFMDVPDVQYRSRSQVRKVRPYDGQSLQKEYPPPNRNPVPPVMPHAVVNHPMH